MRTRPRAGGFCMVFLGRECAESQGLIGKQYSLCLHEKGMLTVCRGSVLPQQQVKKRDVPRITGLRRAT